MKKFNFKRFSKRFWWIWAVLGIGIVILAVIIYSGFKDGTQTDGGHNNQTYMTKDGILIDGGKDGLTRPFTDTELTAANLAIANGIKIEDTQYDWYKFPVGSIQPDGRPDNPEPYPLPWTDFRSVSVGVDQNYIYFKFQFWGEFPLGAVSYNGDLINSTGAKITNFTFTNNEGKKDSADLGAGPWYVTMENNTWVPAENVRLGQGAMISPTGRDEHMETIFKINTGAGMIAGGPGYDYILSAFPLSLFNLKLGDEVTFDSSTETGSKIYHHEAVDILLDKPGEKFGEVVIYKLGSDHYEIMLNPDYSNHS
jgi:hypothetical protein